MRTPNIRYDELVPVSIETGAISEINKKLTKFLAEHEKFTCKDDKGRPCFGVRTYRGGPPKNLSFERWLMDKDLLDAEIAAGARYKRRR